MSSRATALIEKISDEEQLDVAFGIWEKFSQNKITVVLSDEQRIELEKRLAAHEQNPTAGKSWDEINKKLLPK